MLLCVYDRTKGQMLRVGFLACLTQNNEDMVYVLVVVGCCC